MLKKINDENGELKRQRKKRIVCKIVNEIEQRKCC